MTEPSGGRGSVLPLLLPFHAALRHRFFPGGRPSLRTVLLFLLACVVIGLLYWCSARVTGYFHRQNELGIILSLKIFQMAWIVLFAMQVFSCMVSAVSSFFLSQDNEIVFAAPVRTADLFAMRYATTSFYTSWMMLVFSLPIFAAYGTVFKAGFLYWPLMVTAVLATVASATAFSCLAVIAMVQLFPARRTKDIVMYLSLCFGMFIYIMFRLLRPEDLVNPEKYSRFIEYLSAISTPAAPWLPAGWAANLLTTFLLDGRTDGLLLAVLLVTPAALYILGEWAMRRWFFSAWSKAQESFGGYRRFPCRTRPGAAWRLIWRKELKLFLRDSAEWSQLFMIAALIIVYLYNFKLLPVDRSPMEKEYITNLISFLNIGLASFVIISLAARFVFPAISAEGGVFPLVRAAPLAMSHYLAAKYFFYVLPFSVLSFVLIALSDHLLKISGPMWIISVATGQIITWTVVALALGFGALYADFKAESRAAVLGGFGAIAFLFTAAAHALLVIFGGAAPTYRLMRKWVQGQPLTSGDFGLLALFLIVAVGVSLFFGLAVLRRGSRRLTAG